MDIYRLINLIISGGRLFIALLAYYDRKNKQK